MSEDQEDYEHGLDVKVDTRPSNLNQSGEFATYQAWLRELEEAKGCLGRLRRWRWWWWCFLLRIQYLFTDFIIVMSVAGSFYTTAKEGIDDELSFVRAILVGLVVMLVLRGLNYISYKYSVFPETSRAYVEDQSHCSKYLVFLAHLIFFVVGVTFLAQVNDFCSREGKPCLVEWIFNPRVFAKKWEP